MRRLKSALLAAASFIVTSPAFAQQANPSTAPSTVGEVIVTATRRNEAISKVPMSIVATTQAALDRQGIRSIGDLALATPSLSLLQGNNNSKFIAIRGVESTVGASTTGIYIDDTPIQVRVIGTAGGAASAFPALFDLDRVEVLRGPQGTLFGAGSEGGTLRFIQPEPGLTQYTGNMRAEAGSTEHGSPSYDIGAAVGGPIVDDKLGFRFSIDDRHDGGWVDLKPYMSTVTSPKTDANTSDTTAISGALLFAPTSNFRIKASLNYQNVNQAGTGDSWSFPAGGYYTGGQTSGNSIQEGGKDHFILPAIRADWDLGPVKLVSNTAFFDRQNTYNSDYSSFIAALLSGGAVGYSPGDPNYYTEARLDQRQQSFTQEVRLESTNTDAPLTWITGLFYQHAEEFYHVDIGGADFPQFISTLYGGATVTQAFGEPLLPGGIQITQTDHVLDEQYAAFGQADYKFTQWLDVAAGLRVARTNVVFDDFANGPLASGLVSVAGSQSETPVTPKITVTVKPDPNTIVYATAAKGFRVGGVNSAVPDAGGTGCAASLAAIGLTKAPDTFNSDSLWSYELGAKTRTLDDKLQVSASIFDVDWSNIQQQVALPCGYSYTGNLGRATSRGGDVQVAFAATQNLYLSASVAYTDAYYTATSYGGAVGAGAARPVIVSAGDDLPTPPWSANLDAQYKFSLGEQRYYARADYNFSSAFHSGPGPGEPGYVASTYISGQINNVNVRAGTQIHGIDLSIFVNNALDSHDIVQKFNFGNANLSILHELTLRPRTVGITSSYHF